MQTASLMAFFSSELFNNAFSEQTQNYVHYFLIASATERKILVLNLLLAQTSSVWQEYSKE